MPWLTLLQFAGGGALLIIGAELLVRGASRIAIAAGISPLIVGLTVVAFGTSSPELAVTLGAAFEGQVDVALGNVVGSNILNILLILGLAAAIAPVAVSPRLIRLDVPLMIGASLTVELLALDGRLGRLDGALLFGGVLCYTVFVIRQSRRETAAVKAEYEEALAPASAGPERWWRDITLVLLGLLMLTLGSEWLVDAAVAVATALGVSELVIGLTVVAVGTSLPEVATSVLATMRGERDIAVGNVVGSNLFNLLAVLGIGSLVAPSGIAVAPGALTFDIPVMIAVAVATLPIFFTGYAIARWEGVVFLGYYAAYTTFIILAATHHHALPRFTASMLYFIIPLTVLTLAVITARTIHRNNRAGAQ